MNKIIIVLCMLFSVITHSQNDSIPSITETERIIDKYGEKVIEGFEKAVTNVTPMAEDAFAVVVKLQVAKGITRLLPIFFSIFCVWFFYKTLDSYQKSDNKNGEDVRIGAMVISGIIGIISVITAFFVTSTGIQMIIAPEWFAIKEIMNLF